MQFVLTGFTHDTGFRVFAFDRIGEDRVRTKCTVRTDLALVRTYGIHVQELPLLCRGLLDRSDESEEIKSLTFTEEEMRAWAKARDEAVTKRKAPHRPSGGHPSAAWRGQHP